jgi:hypothetical protein
MSYAIVKVRSYGRYDIKGFRFRSAKFESTRPFVVITNARVI